MDWAIAQSCVAGLPGLREVLPELLSLRNRALLAPCRGSDTPEGCVEYWEALLTLSGQMDRLAGQVVRGEAEEVTKSLGRLSELANQAYGLAL